MPAASCENCGSALPKGSRFCPECGTRVGAGPGETAVEELPADETGQVPVEYQTVRPRYFGVFRPAKALAPVWRALLAKRAECARLLGEAVYADDEEGTKTARAQLAELDGLLSAKEEEMEQTAAEAMERIQRAQLQVQPTQIETPEPVPEPFPEPSPAPQPVPVPEPTPEPSEPPGPAQVPEPTPVPSPPPQPE